MSIAIPAESFRDAIAAMASAGVTEAIVDAKGTKMPIDPTQSGELQTDKKMIKIVGCRECRRPLGVTTFFAPAKAICSICSIGKPRIASVGQASPDTDPAHAVNLADCLINKHFAQALCPVHPEDPEHIMELKAVSHSDNYGPGHYGAKGEWIQEAPGEVATHQCLRCNARVDYSTTIRVQLARQNEPKNKPDFGPPERNYAFGLREAAA